MHLAGANASRCRQRTGQGLQCGLHSHLLNVGHRRACTDSKATINLTTVCNRHDLVLRTDLGDVLVRQVLQVARRGVSVLKTHVS